jgi:ankyrin repeat protein
MYASEYGHTAAVKAIVAADPHPDHIRMTEVRFNLPSLLYYPPYVLLYRTPYTCLLIRSVSSPPPSSPLLSQYQGWTALIIAARKGHPRIVDMLIKADPSGDHLNMKVG